MLQNQQKKTKIPSALLDCVRIYAKAGYATFATTEDKRPAPGLKWKEAKIDTIPHVMRYPHGMFGVRLKADDLIIDLDPRNMGKRKVWSELKHQVFNLVDIEKQATIVRTGGGGIHIYLRKPSTFKVRKHLPEFPGVDFLSEGAYVIGAGSKREGKEYLFMSMPFAEVGAPRELLNLIQRQTVDLGEINPKGFNDTFINMGKFVQYLQTLAPLAIAGEHGDLTTYKIACRGREFNLSMQKTFDLMLQYYNPKCKPMWEPRELQRKVSNAYVYDSSPPGKRTPEVAFAGVEFEEDKKKWMIKLEKTKNKVYKMTMRNCVLMLQHELGIKGIFIYNSFNERLEIKGRIPWQQKRINRYNTIDDREIECIRLHLAEKFFVEFSTQTVWKAVDLVAAGNVYHPIKDTLETYKWDGVPRVDTWLEKYCGSSTTLFNKQIGRKTLCAMVARIYSPGCKFDYVLILEGMQGIGKSTACEILGGPWYGDAPVDPKDKDSIPYIHSKWVVELSEMITTRKTESDRLKNFLSRREDDVRLPYARARQRFPRQCVFIGTINPDDVGYLTDTTGNRRFWPVFCKWIDTEGLKRDREQILAEAVVLYKKGEILTLPPELIKQSEIEAAKRLVDDPWMWVIAEWLVTEPERTEVSTQHVYRNVIGGTVQGMHTGHQRRIALSLRSLGWTKHQTLSGLVYRKAIRVEGDK